MRSTHVLLSIILCLLLSRSTTAQVTITDSFWLPKLTQWRVVTSNDVLNKFEPVFKNFDDVAQGKKGTGHHEGLPWFDGLVYETIRGIAGFLQQQRDPVMEARLDKYIERIYAAQKADPDGYINTYTDLMEPTHRWGDNGGMLRFQHDVYNAGMLIEAGVHYYKATGKTRLLEVATRFANYMCNLMGAAPKRNIVPAHSGPEEAMVKLYWLYRDHPTLKNSIGMPVHEKAYYDLAKFWIENRGNNCGYPHWQELGNPKAEQWIKEQRYKEFGAAARPSWGDYAQDSISIFKQQTIEGHAVRATLLATGITAIAQESHDTAYISTATRLWDNMAGKRMFITGGVGAIHDDEKFGPDYFLPTDAYLETCAAVGVGFFSQRMNELTKNGKYMDEFERVLYNNVLTGVSLSGTQYTYQNPLNSHEHARWDWHSCPCCPPMFLKIVSLLPDYIYATDKDKLYVNLFIGSDTKVSLSENTVTIKQETNYPWNGKIKLDITPSNATAFTVKIRIPGWAQGKENPYGLYISHLDSSVTLKVNGKDEKLLIRDGYASITRKWKKGDQVIIDLPMQPRIIYANSNVKDLDRKVTLASGPLVYCMEKADNADLDKLVLDVKAPLQLHYEAKLLNGVNIITGMSKTIPFKAIPFYAIGNRPQKGYKVWVESLSF